jgi:hypothetical protein
MDQARLRSRSTPKPPSLSENLGIDRMTSARKDVASFGIGLGVGSNPIPLL